MTRRTQNGPIRVPPPAVLVALVVVGGLVVAAVPAGASSATADDSAFVVAVDADGDAEVTLRIHVDLGDEADREIVERIERNGTAVAERFRDRLSTVAERTESATGRSMQVSDASASVTTGNSTATVELSTTWRGLAAVEGDRLVLTEPFASGFQPAHRFVVRAPEGYSIASATPAPDERSTDAVAWSAGADLDGFRVEFAPDGEAGARETAAGPMPGFGLGAALAGLLVVVGLGRYAVRR